MGDSATYCRTVRVLYGAMRSTGRKDLPRVRPANVARTLKQLSGRSGWSCQVRTCTFLPGLATFSGFGVLPRRVKLLSGKWLPKGIGQLTKIGTVSSVWGIPYPCSSSSCLPCRYSGREVRVRGVYGLLTIALVQKYLLSIESTSCLPCGKVLSGFLAARALLVLISFFSDIVLNVHRCE